MFKRLILSFMMFVSRRLIKLRYRVKITGVDKVLSGGRRGILFLPNHPALLDPIILTAYLYPKFHQRVLADSEQIDRFIIRYAAGLMKVIPLEEVHGQDAAAKAARAMDICADLLNQGENVLIYPSGHIYRSWKEDIAGKSGAFDLVKAVDDARVVLVRTSGLWGSEFSWAGGNEPHVGPTLKKGLGLVLKNFLFFMPKREVTVEFHEPDELPRDDKNAFNRYLEDFYNADARNNTYVPQSIWEGGGIVVRPEPERVTISGDPNEVSDHIRDEVFEFISELTHHPEDELKFETRLAHDLGLDSLSGMELVTWLQDEFGFSPTSVEDMATVGDVVLAAAGEGVASSSVKLKPVGLEWTRNLSTSGKDVNWREVNITRAIFEKARLNKDCPIMADQIAGVKTYRDLMLAMFVLVPRIKKIPGKHIGIMMPASVSGAVMYVASVLAGKIPTMMNWTLGRKNLEHCLTLVPIEKILTAGVVVSKIKAQGSDIEAIEDKFLFVDEMLSKLGKLEKLKVFLQSRLCWSKLKKWADSADRTAAVLFTSGSENMPKAVPLTHHNIMTNLDCVIGSREKAVEKLDPDDVLMGMLPPFHSFGITVCTVLPLIYGLRVVYCANPTDGAVLAKSIEAYGVSMLVGTPTFLNGIMRAGSNKMLETLRLVVSGAEKCPPKVYQLLSRRCNQTVVLEGYGATECSPIISVNQLLDHEHETIGKVLDAFEYAIVDPDTHERCPQGTRGLLLVRGDCVFDGYYNYDGPSPLVEFEGKQWYSTGDLVVEHRPGGWLTFAGRLKRFVKLGGEMISLPAIESVLMNHFADPDEEEQPLAVVAKEVGDQPEIVLVTTQDITREQANTAIRQAGLSGLHNVRIVKSIPEIPLLGTGKVDYRSLVSSVQRNGWRI